MNEFDAYHKWLGIPPQEQPPTHYRLLGIPAFTSDPEVIENAADQRMAHLRSASSGPRYEIAQRLLNHLATARHCLLDPEYKQDYDRWLNHCLAASLPTCEPPPLPTPAPATPARAIAPAHRRFRAVRGSSGPSANSTPAKTIISCIVGGIAGLAIAYSILCLINKDNDFLKLIPRNPKDEVAGKTPEKSKGIPLPTRQNFSASPKPKITSEPELPRPGQISESEPATEPQPEPAKPEKPEQPQPEPPTSPEPLNLKPAPIKPEIPKPEPSKPKPGWPLPTPPDKSAPKPLRSRFSDVNLTGTWKNPVSGNKFILSEDGKGIVVKANGQDIQSLIGRLSREGDRIVSAQWDTVFSNDPSRQVRSGECSGTITSRDRIAMKFSAWKWDAKGKTTRTYTRNAVWERESPLQYQNTTEQKTGDGFRESQPITTKGGKS